MIPPSSEVRKPKANTFGIVHQRRSRRAKPACEDPAARAAGCGRCSRGRIIFAPERRGYWLRGATKIGALWGPAEEAGGTRVEMASPKGPTAHAPPGELPWEWRV